jgi:hypothetical protein
MSVQKKLQIGVIGYAGVEEYPIGSIKEDIYKIAERVGFLLAEKGAIIVTGGKGGVMESAAFGAKKAGGITVGIIKGNKRFKSNDFTEVEILTGMEADGFDEFMLVSMCDAFIMIGGGAGTLEEIIIAYRNKKPIIVIKNTGGWADKISEECIDERKTVKVDFVSTPEEAVEKVFSILKR